MTLPLGQRTLRERRAPHILVERAPESKGFRHGIGKKPLTVRARLPATGVTAALHCCADERRADASLQGPRGCAPAVTPGYAVAPSSSIVTDVIATGESGRSRLFRGALTILSTTSMPFVTWPKIT